jgi:hypothetical protein
MNESCHVVHSTVLSLADPRPCSWRSLLQIAISFHAGYGPLQTTVRGEVQLAELGPS